MPGVACSLTLDTGRRQRRRCSAGCPRWPRRARRAAAAAGRPRAGRARDRHRDMTIREKVTLSPNAVAVFSIVDQQATPNAGGIVGEQRIDGATTPVEFSVPYDTTSINPKQSYAMFGSVIDGSTVYQSFEPVPGHHRRPDQRGRRRRDRQAARRRGRGDRHDRPAREQLADVVRRRGRDAHRLDTGTTIARQVIPSRPSCRSRSRSRSTRASSTRPTPTSSRRASSTAARPGRASRACPRSRTASS